jgi:large subunit ribosomal protein L21
MIYAIIETGGKQYKAEAGQVIQIEKLLGEDGEAARTGGTLQFDKVLFFSKPGETASEVSIGNPYVNSALVKGEIVGVGRGKKTVIMKMKRRKQYDRTQGHRQEQLQVLITSLEGGAGFSDQISSEQIIAKKKSFVSLLKPKGLAFTPKTLGGKQDKKDASIARKAAKVAAKTGTVTPRSSAPKKAAKKV